jgi:hypothetical protein
MRSIIAMPFKMVKGQAARCSDLTNAVKFAQRPELSQHRRDIVILSKGIASPLCALEHSAESLSGAVLALIPALTRVPCHRLKLASLLLSES